MFKIILITLMLMLVGFGCATTSQDECSVEKELVSICRARQKCKLKKTNYGVGLGLSGPATTNLGLIHERSLATENYMDCVEKDLELQRAANQIKQDEKKVIDH